MRVLDLFCGGGGAAEGYRRAGCELVGVDLDDHSANYTHVGRFYQADALEFLRLNGHLFDLIHASPPCQAYSTAVVSKSSRWNHTRGKDEPMLIEPLRELLEASGKPYIIENVRGAREYLQDPIELCGTMFDLPTSRHRYFECYPRLAAPAHPKCIGVAKRFAAEKGWEYRDMSVTGKGRRAGTAERWKEILGIEHHMTQHELAESIPPAYTHYLAKQMRKKLCDQNMTLTSTAWDQLPSWT